MGGAVIEVPREMNRDIRQPYQMDAAPRMGSLQNETPGAKICADVRCTRSGLETRFRLHAALVAQARSAMYRGETSQLGSAGGMDTRTVVGQRFVRKNRYFRF